MYKKNLKGIKKIKNTEIYIFSKTKKNDKQNYNSENSIEHYKNFLNWLIKTFKTNNKKLREDLFKNIKFKKNQKILITGVGNGDDVDFLIKKKKNLGLKIYIQDLSEKFITHCYKRFHKHNNIFFNLSNANHLPFKDNVFDHTYHFGGINLFGNIRKSINEMFRVTKDLGSINFGDEGVANWLRNTVYAEMVINNNKLWNRKIPLNYLPFNSSDVKIRWLLGNCFYFINIKKNNKFPNVNFKVKHKSPRGGSIYSRYFEYKKKKINKFQLNKKLN